jgi:uncharacterized protein YndB with AHSA1/START domain
MTERTVQHSTIVLERTYNVSPARIFAAWSNSAERVQWDVPGHDWELADHQQDFRVGGRETSRFGPKGDPKHWAEGRYLDIVPDARIVSAGTMHSGDMRTSATLCTIELVANGTGTRLILTDQSAFFDGLEKPADRESGWGSILNKLTAYLKRKPTSG